MPEEKFMTFVEAVNYYYGVLEFVGRDGDGQQYLAFIVSDPQETRQYAAVPVGDGAMASYLAGNTDMRTLLVDRPESTWFLTEDAGQTFRLLPQDSSLADADLLPEAGFFVTP